MGRTGARRTRVRKGSGLLSSVASKVVGTVGDIAGTVLNRAVDALPVELHIPGYHYCGPGTRLEERLRRGDVGINPLDEACKRHDIAYQTYSDTKKRAEADKELANLAWQRVTSDDASVAEKAAAWAVTNIMKTKGKLGGGVRKKKTQPKKQKGKGMYLRPYQPTKTGCGNTVTTASQKGAGMYLRPYNPATECCDKAGRGMYLRPYQPVRTGCGHQTTKNAKRQTTKKKRQ